MIAAKTQQKHYMCSHRGACIRAAGASVVRLVPAAGAVGAGRAGLHVAGVPVGRVRSRGAVAERAVVVAGGAAALAAAAVVAAAQGMRLPPARVVAQASRRNKVAVEGHGDLRGAVLARFGGGTVTGNKRGHRDRGRMVLGGQAAQHGEQPLAWAARDRRIAPEVIEGSVLRGHRAREEREEQARDHPIKIGGPHAGKSPRVFALEE